jgi:hypothetical protein
MIELITLLGPQVVKLIVLTGISLVGITFIIKYPWRLNNMKVTLFELNENKKAHFKKATPGYGLEDSARKWREAYYLIKRGYSLYDLDTTCGLCEETEFGCVGCALETIRFCGNIRARYFPDKGDIKDIKDRWKQLQELANDAKGKVT